MAFDTILTDKTGTNGIPQYFDTTGAPKPLTGDKAPYGQIVDNNGAILFTATNPGKVDIVGGMAITSLPSIPAGSNIIGLVKLSDGTDTLLINTNGSINAVPVNSAGTELWTATNPGNVQLTGSNAKGKETLTVAAAAVGFVAVSAGAAKAFITNEAAQIRYWVDGSAPTTTSGHLVNVGDAIKLDSAGQIANFKAIAVSGSATLQITYS